MSNDYEQTPGFIKGEARRRQVLGDTHVSRSLDKASGDKLLQPIQQLTTEFGWGEVWMREGLEPKTRSFLSMSFLAANGKHEEFRTHVRGAVNNGASVEEIREVLIQAALYCGFPVGLECTRIAHEVLQEMGVETTE